MKFLFDLLSVLLDPEHFIAVIIGLRDPIRIEVTDCLLEVPEQNPWFLCWCDQRIGVNKSEHGPKYNLSTQVWTGVIDGLCSHHR